MESFGPPVFWLLISCKEMIQLSMKLLGPFLSLVAEETKCILLNLSSEAKTRRGKSLLIHFVVKSAALKTALESQIRVKLQVLDCCLVLLSTGETS